MVSRSSSDELMEAIASGYGDVVEFRFNV